MAMSNTLGRVVFVAFVLWISNVQASINKSANSGGKPVAEYLPADTVFDPAIPTPESVLGQQVGSWHVRHDQLVTYMKALSAASDRVSLIETGKTHENRSLLLLTFTSPSNQTNLEQIKRDHIQTISTGARASKDAPLVLYMGYSIHGNEPSGSNAALVVAYYLAAAQNDEVNTLLKDNIVLLDPSLNPDGLSRFAQWANMHKGINRVADRNHREHQEAWPNGRTNHYWFDLNRDWLLLTHPESQARIAQFHSWRPHVLTDFHEMGTDSTYFFQPGVPSRKHPLTPDGNVTLTEALAEFHAAAFDQAKVLYFSQESFDDFYYGKGSTYPDAHGSVGILFEQASSRGHLQESINGPLAFSQTIQNHVTTSLSTFKGALANKPALLNYQTRFFSDTQKAIKDDDTLGYIVSVEKDSERMAQLVSILSQHQIEFRYLDKPFSSEAREYQPDNTIFVALDQPQYRLIKSMFSTQQTFAENTFYDVSNWNIALAFNAIYEAIPKSKRRTLKTREQTPNLVSSQVNIAPNAYAYAFEWHNYNAPALLQFLLKNQVNVRVSKGAFTAKTSNGEKAFDKGTIVVPLALTQPERLAQLLASAATELGVSVSTVLSGLTTMGSDLGSRTMAPVHLPSVLIVGGEGVSPYDTGEIWHYLDTRVGIAATIVDNDNLKHIELSQYTHIVFPNGRYRQLNESTVEALDNWVAKGGVMIGFKSSLSWMINNGWLDLQELSRDAIDNSFDTTSLSFSDKDALYAQKLIAGAAYQTTIDLTHPLFYGFEQDSLAFFKTSNRIFKGKSSPFTEIAHYSASPLLAGFTAPELQRLVADTVAVAVEQHGRGVVIGFVDNIHFRGYWRGTDKLMSNAIYLSPLMH